jgi:hypothetical protein
LLKDFANFYKKNEFSFLPITLFILLDHSTLPSDIDLALSEQFPILDRTIGEIANESNQFLSIENVLKTEMNLEAEPQ